MSEQASISLSLNSTPSEPFLEEDAIYQIITSTIVYLSMSADIFSSISCLISMVIFKRLGYRSPLYLLLFVLSATQFCIALFDTIEYLDRFIAGQIEFSTGDFWLEVVYPLMYFLYLFQMWLIVLILVERWSKYRNIAPWSNMKTIRVAVFAFILCLAFNMIRFFESAITRNNETIRRLYMIIYSITLDLLVGFFIPYPIIIGFSLFLACRALNKPISRLNYEEKCERDQTKTALLVGTCFVLGNSLGFALFFLQSTNIIGWDSIDYQVFMILIELQIMLGSINILMNAAFYLIFFKDYRRLFMGLLYKILHRCGCQKSLSGQSLSDATTYSALENNGDIDQAEEI